MFCSWHNLNRSDPWHRLANLAESDLRLIQPYRKFALRAFLALALLFAQAGAQAHSYSHLKGPDPAGVSSQLCGECLSFAPLLATAGAPDSVFVFHCRLVAEVTHAPAASLVPHVFHHAFRSRAPPHLI